MKKTASLVTGTALEILSAAIIYAGIDNKDNMMICIGAAMFVIGFAILQWRGSAKKYEARVEKRQMEVDIEKVIDMIPEDVRDNLGQTLKGILGIGVEDLTGQGNLK